MKRKKLFQFADWLEKSRTPFNIGDSSKCVSFQACRFNGDVKNNFVQRSPNRAGFSEGSDLQRIFDLDVLQARTLYSGFNWGCIDAITRKVAAGVVRKLAHTGKVDWGKFAATDRLV